MIISADADMTLTETGQYNQSNTIEAADTLTTQPRTNQFGPTETIQETVISMGKDTQTGSYDGVENDSTSETTEILSMPPITTGSYRRHG